jgi:hypothetical protein
MHTIQTGYPTQQSVAVNRMTGQQTEPIYQTSSHHAVEQSSMLGIFFVALASSTETAVGDNNNSLLENVSTVINARFCPLKGTTATAALGGAHLKKLRRAEGGEIFNLY